MNQDTVSVFPGILSDPANIRELEIQVREGTDAVEVFHWFRRLLLLPQAYINRDIITVDGDIVRKAIRCSAAVPVRELAKIANSSTKYHRSLPAFIAACLLVTRRIDERTRNHVPFTLDNCQDNFQRCIALISAKCKPSSVWQAQYLVSEKNCVAVVLRTAGYPDQAREIGRQICSFSQKVRRMVHKSRFRAYTDRWTFSIGHIVILGYLIKAHEAGLLEEKGVRIWRGAVANRCLLDHVTALSSDFEYVKARTTFGDNHSVNHSELLGGEYLNYFEACGRIADLLGDEWGAILPRPSRSDAGLRDFLDSAGLDPGDRIVTLHCREAGFRVDNRHDMRNVEIASYLPAIRRLTERGYKVVRLGDRSMTPLPPVPGLVDYARSPLKSPKLDVVLPATADFHIGSSSGLSLVPLMFGTPCLYLNWYPLDMVPWGRGNWTVLRPLRSTDGSGPITDPSVYFKVGRLADRSLLAAAGVEPVDLSEDQLAGAVTAFSEELERRSSAPGRAGRNLGHVFMAAPDGHAVSLIELPVDSIPVF